MKLLFDANISRKIAPMIEDLFQGSSHVVLLGFSGETADDVIWEFAGKTTSQSRTAADLIRRNAIAISEFEMSSRKAQA